jgi:ElaB/YqjD/DUF883 family membrane-anchored ribosome-binding protein
MATKVSFWKRVETELKNMFGSTKWEKTASGALLYFGPALELLVGLAGGGPAEALVTSVVTKAQGALASLSAVVNDAITSGGASPSNLSIAMAALNSIKTNLSQLLASAEIKNAPKSAEITSAVNAIVEEVDAYVANLPPATVGVSGSSGSLNVPA